MNSAFGSSAARQQMILPVGTQFRKQKTIIIKEMKFWGYNMLISKGGNGAKILVMIDKYLSDFNEITYWGSWY